MKPLAAYGYNCNHAVKIFMVHDDDDDDDDDNDNDDDNDGYVQFNSIRQ